MYGLCAWIDKYLELLAVLRLYVFQNSAPTLVEVPRKVQEGQRNCKFVKRRSNNCRGRSKKATGRSKEGQNSSGTLSGPFGAQGDGNHNSKGTLSGPFGVRLVLVFCSGAVFVPCWVVLQPLGFVVGQFGGSASTRPLPCLLLGPSLGNIC